MIAGLNGVAAAWVASRIVWAHRLIGGCACSIVAGSCPRKPQVMSSMMFHRMCRIGSVLMSIAMSAIVQAAPVVNAPAPDFALRAFDGANYRLSEYRGDVVMLVFWGTWCGDCRAGVGEVERLWRTYSAAGLMVVGVNLDEREEAAIAFTRAVGTTFPVVRDSTKGVSRAFRIDALPTVVLLDRDGRVRFVAAGRGDEASRLGDRLRKLLDE